MLHPGYCVAGVSTFIYHVVVQTNERDVVRLTPMTNVLANGLAAL